MRDLQDKIIELEEWRSTEKKIPSSLPTIKGYDITVYSIATEECQDLAYRFEKNARKDLTGMMDLYEKSTYVSKGIFDGQRSISRMNIQSHLLCLINLKVIMKRLRWRSKPKKNFCKKISKSSS